ncbi:MAG: MFS transporter [Gaiellales bacterium]
MERTLSRALFTRDFSLLFTGQAVSVLGDGLFTIALSFAVLEITGSAGLGLVLAVGSLPMVGLVLVGGVWADRVGRRRLMIAADAGRAAVQLVLAVLVISGSAQLWELLVLQLLYGVGQAFFGPASMGIIPQVLDDDTMLRSANGVLGANRSIMFMLGAAVGGLLVAELGTGTTIALDATSFAVSALCLSLMRMHRAATPAAAASFLHDLREGFREVRRHRWLWMTLINAFGFLMLYVAPINVLGPLIAKADLGGSRAWGFIEAAFGLGMAAGGIFAATVRLRAPVPVAGVLFLASSVTPLLLAVAVPVPITAAAFACEGLGAGIFVAVWEAELQRQIPAEMLSRVSAWDWMGSLAGMPLGFVAGGFAAHAVGIDPTLYGIAVCASSLGIWLLLSPTMRSIGARTRRVEPAG